MPPLLLLGIMLNRARELIQLPICVRAVRKGMGASRGLEGWNHLFCHEVVFMVGLSGHVTPSLLLAVRTVKARGVVDLRALPG